VGNTCVDTRAAQFPSPLPHCPLLKGIPDMTRELEAQVVREGDTRETGVVRCDADLLPTTMLAFTRLDSNMTFVAV